MSLTAKYLKLRLFAEGEELPVVNAVITMSINSPATGVFSVIPIDEIHQLKPHCLIHAFYYDFLDNRDVDPEDFTRYKLLFVGETVSFQYTKTPLGRSAILQCLDLTNTWSHSFQYQITYGPQGNFLTPSAVNYAAGTDKFSNIIDGHLGVLGRYLNSTPKSPGLRGLKGLLGGIVVLIEQFNGVVGHQKGVQDYPTVAELKNKTMQQITAEENDDTALRIFQAKEFYEWLENGLSKLGELCSLWDMIRLLFQYIYYEYAPVMSPLYKAGTDPDKFSDTDKINKILKEVSISLYDNKDLRDIRTRAGNAVNELTTLLEYPALSKKQKDFINKAISNLLTVATAFTYSEKITKNLANGKINVDKAMIKLDETEAKSIDVERLNTIIFKPECYFVAPPRCNVIFPEHNTQFSFSRNYDQEYTRLRLQSAMQFGIDQDQILADFSYAPSGKEITQVAQQQGVGKTLSAILPWEKFTGVLPKFEYIQDINYVANKAQKEVNKNVKTTTQPKSNSDLQKTVQNLARSYKQKAANFNFYKYRFMAREMSGSCRFNPMLVVGFPLVVIDKPFIVDREKLIDLAKQQGTTIDKITQQDIIDNIKDFAETLKAPNQFIGYPVTISHMIGQDGATTSFNCTHARIHRITGDDFLQIYKAQAEETFGKVTIKTVLDATDLQRKQNFKDLKLLIDLTPQQAPQKTDNTPQLNRPKINISGFDVLSPTLRSPSLLETGDYVGETQDEEIDGGVMRVPTKFGKLQPNQKGPNGTITTIRITNDFIKKINFEGKDVFVWQTVILYEETDGKILKPIPIEHILKPSWFSPNYENTKIGEQIFQPFLGCGSIVDELVFKSPQGLSIQGGGDSRMETLDKIAESGESFFDSNKLQQKDLASIPSVESAIDILAFQYAEIITNELDISRFINDYTRREVANMAQVMGSSDLELTQVGNEVKVVQGKLGFHSVGISGFDNLAGLTTTPDLPLESRDKKQTIPPSVDPRKERKQSVLNYKNALGITDEEIVGISG